MFATGFSMRPERDRPRTRAARASSSCWTGRPSTTRTCSPRSPRRGADGRYRNNAIVAAPGRQHRTLRQDPSVQLRRRARALRGRRPSSVTVDVDGLRVSAVRLLRPAIRRRVLGAAPQDTDLYVVPANWPRAAARALAGPAAGPGDREPGLRGRREPRRDRSNLPFTPGIRRYRPAGRHPGRGRSGRGGAGRRTSTAATVAAECGRSSRSWSTAELRSGLTTRPRIARINSWSRCRSQAVSSACHRLGRDLSNTLAGGQIVPGPASQEVTHK